MNYLRLAFLLVCVSLGGAHAAPNLMGTIKGLGSVTKDPVINPINGPIAKPYIRNLRYYGNYGSNQEKSNPVMLCIVKETRSAEQLAGQERKADNCPQDAVTSLIQWLFPNFVMDGNFAPNRREVEDNITKGIFDIVSKFTPSMIGVILNEIHKHSENLEILSTDLTEALVKQFIEEGIGLGESQGAPMKDYGALYVALTEKNHPNWKEFFELMDGETTAKKEIGQKYKGELTQEQKQAKKAAFQELKEKYKKTKQEVTLLKQYRAAKKKGGASASKLKANYAKAIDIFSQIVSQALMQSKNTEAVTGEVYHPNTVEMALQLFGWEISQSKQDIVKILEAMPAAISSELVKSYAESTDSYSATEYYDKKQGFKTETDHIVPKTQLEGSDGLELAAFLGFGYQLFEGDLPERIGYEQVPLLKEKYDPKAKKREEAAESFPDCGSSSLRNVFNFLLYDNETKIFEINKLVTAAGLKSLNVHQKLADFYTDHKDLNSVLTSPARHDWARVTSYHQALDGDLYHNALTSDPTAAPVCEIYSGVTNMMTIIGALLGTEASVEKGDNIDMSNLITLLSLISTEDNKWKWKTESGNKFVKNSENKAVNIIFYKNKEEIFTWEFEDGHFDTSINVAAQMNWLTQTGANILKTQDIPGYVSLFLDKNSIPETEGALPPKFASYILYTRNLEDTDVRLKSMGFIGSGDHKNHTNLGTRIIDSLETIARSDPATMTKVILNASKSASFIEYAQNKFGFDINKKFGGQKFTPLHFATQHTQGTDVMGYLIDNLGAKVNVKGSNNETPVHLASKKGDLDKVQFLIGKDENVGKLIKSQTTLGAKTLSGRTNLHLASESHKPALVEFFIERGLSVGAADNNGHTAIHLAAKQGDLPIVMLLHKKGGNLERKDRSNKTLLHFAAGATVDSPELMEYILSNTKMDVNAQDTKGFSVLHYAVERSNDFIINLLLRKDEINVNLKTTDGGLEKTPLHLAVENYKLSTVELLVENGADIESTYNVPRSTIESHTPLVQSWTLYTHGLEIEDGVNYKEIAKEIFEFLVSKNANIEAPYTPQSRETILRRAVYQGDIEAVTYLLSKGANPNTADKDGKTPLHHAKTVGISKLLIDSGADVNATDTEGRTPFHHVQTVEMAKLLLEHRADVNATDKEGNTPIHNAKNVGMAKLLIDNGADVNATDSEGNTPIQNAARKGDFLTVKFLKTNGARLDVIDENNETLLHSIVKAHVDNTELLEYILTNSNIDASAQDKDGNTPLHIVVGKNNMTAAKEFIRRGANVDLKNVIGMAPLHLAASSNNLAAARVLIENKATVDLKSEDESQKTPLLIAVALKKDTINLVKLLIESGASLEVKDTKYESTPLHYAAQSSTLDVVKLLVESGADVHAKNKRGRTPSRYAVERNIKQYLRAKIKETILPPEAAGEKAIQN